MQDYDGDIRRLMDAAARTEIVRAPRQHLLTFGVTKLHYYIVTEPSYRELVPGAVEAVIREGDVAAQRPAVVTPTYMAHLEGFGEDAYRYFADLAHKYGSNSPGLLYQYANEPGEMSIVEGTAQAVAERISAVRRSGLGAACSSKWAMKWMAKSMAIPNTSVDRTAIGMS